ncbi:acyl-CoA synthetase [Sphingobium lactosutens]|uniref:long-chain-fatty-acid--CoA ligase n=1 Tax=Sphingobium lactosutens TaxID=522773 RepID=UPI0015BC2D99|nr:long-chain-fatty-acid--CoA ligase [Sphingobium lactosutens]NWK98723.1 acyl-CoA synthetase [Sphingobium lactosutens]
MASDLVRPRFTSLADMIEAQASRHGTKAALRFRGRETGYADLARHARDVAGALKTSECAAGDRIAYFGKNSDVYYELLLGAAWAGVTLVPVNWRLAAQEAAWLLEDADCRIIFVTPDHAQDITQLAQSLPLRPPVVIVDGDDPATAYADWRASGGGIAVEQARDPEAIAVQIYTSGTTGRPKGALLSQRALLVFRSLPEAAQPEWNRWTQDDVSLIVMPQFHIGGTGFGLQTLCAGATGLVAEEFSADLVLDAIEHQGLSKLFTVPSALQLVMRHPRVRQVDYGRIRTIVYGASPMPLDVLREAMDIFRCGFVQQYGMTEMCGTISVLPPEDHEVNGNSRMTSAGRALDGVEIAIVDPDGRRLGRGESGEVVIRSPTAMTGYWNLPEATAEAFDAQGYFRSGDAGYLDEDGYLHLRDRIKDMIVSGGENVFPVEVENAIRDHADVADVAVIGVPDPLWGEAVKAVVVLTDGAIADGEAIRAWARRTIAGYKVPKTVDFIDALPRNASGKVLKRELRAPYWTGHDRSVA